VPDDKVILAERSDVADFIEPLGLQKGSCDRVLESQPLVLALMIEKVKGRTSAWAPYLAFLPASFGHLPAMWMVRLPMRPDVVPHHARHRLHMTVAELAGEQQSWEAKWASFADAGCSVSVADGW
jgi:hypothetical protein